MIYKKVTAISVYFAFLAIFVSVLCRGSASASNIAVNGMWYGISGFSSAESVSRDFVRLKEIGFDTIFFTGTVFQDTVTSTKVDIPDDNYVAQVRMAVKEAQKAGLKVTLTAFLIVKDGTWRGAIMPQSRPQWAKSYAAAIVPFAKLARETGADLFCIGSEMETMKFETKLWKLVAESVRKEYKGKIGFNLNWWHNQASLNEIFTRMAWLKDMDFLGVSSYFELDSGDTASADALAADWRKDRTGRNVYDQLKQLREKLKKPLYIWELGYRSVKGSARQPWNYSTDAEPDADMQASCFKAFFKVFGDGKLISGFSVWAADEGLKPTDKGYDIAGKAAENVFKEELAKHDK